MLPPLVSPGACRGLRWLEGTEPAHAFPGSPAGFLGKLWLLGALPLFGLLFSFIRKPVLRLWQSRGHHAKAAAGILSASSSCADLLHGRVFLEQPQGSSVHCALWTSDASVSLLRFERSLCKSAIFFDLRRNIIPAKHPNREGLRFNVDWKNLSTSHRTHCFSSP